MRSVAWVAGLSVLGAYLLGTIPFGYLLTRRRLRRDIRRADLDLRSMLTGVGAAAGRRGDDILAAACDAAKVLLAATLAWHAVEAAAPGFDRHLLPHVSAVGFLSDQVLSSWQSIGIWSGLAAVAGHLASPWLGFRRGQGQLPALALVFVYCPLGFSAGTAVFFVAYAVLRGRRPSLAVLGGLAGFVAYTWLAWIFDWRTSWGAVNGPELSLWATVLAGVIATRTLSDDPGRRPEPAT